VRDVRRSYVRDQYPAVVRNNRLRTSDVRRLRDEASGFGYTPVVSILMPVLRPEQGALEKTLESVLDQA
jgi:hypothetical protein